MFQKYVSQGSFPYLRFEGDMMENSVICHWLSLSVGFKNFF